MGEENRKQVAIHPDNYDFRLLSYSRSPEEGFYVLEARPKVNNTFSFLGQIWVDEREFAIVRIEGEPAKSPSWWIKQSHFRQSYQKLGNFWLPASNSTASQVRFW